MTDVNEISLRWLDGLLRDDPKLGNRIAEMAVNRRQDAKYRHDGYTEQLQTATGLRALVLMVERNAERSRMTDFDDILYAVQQRIEAA